MTLFFKKYLYFFWREKYIFLGQFPKIEDIIQSFRVYFRKIYLKLSNFQFLCDSLNPQKSPSENSYFRFGKFQNGLDRCLPFERKIKLFDYFEKNGSDFEIKFRIMSEQNNYVLFTSHSLICNLKYCWMTFISFAMRRTFDGYNYRKYFVHDSKASVQYYNSAVIQNTQQLLFQRLSTSCNAAPV